MQLSSSGDYFKITKKIPLKNKYILSADDRLIKREQDRLKRERIQREKDPNIEPSKFQNEKELAKELAAGEY